MNQFNTLPLVAAALKSFKTVTAHSALKAMLALSGKGARARPRLESCQNQGVSRSGVWLPHHVQYEYTANAEKEVIRNDGDFFIDRIVGHKVPEACFPFDSDPKEE